MADPVAAPERALGEREQDERGRAIGVYIVYLVGLFTALPFLIGVILAYIFRGDTTDPMRSHFSKQIGLFWWGIVIWPVIGFLTIPLLGLGFVIMGLSWVWMLIRCVQGVIRVRAGEAWA